MLRCRDGGFAQSDLVLTGGTVLIDHGFGLSSSFLHMSRLDVKAGIRSRPDRSSAPPA
jgi:murein DD-endopeptidase MepM/ murein hydrolase activator NlpD